MSASARGIFIRFLIVSGLLMLSLSFIFTAYVRFLVERGMDLFQVGLINGFYAGTIFLLEIPTGVVADLFGRKVSSLVGILLKVIAMLYYYSARTIEQFILAETMAAAGSAFISGAFEAWMIDALKVRGYDGRLEKIHATHCQIEKACTLLGGVIGAFLITRNNLAIGWIYSGVGMGLAGILAFAILPQDSGKKTKIAVCSGWRVFKSQIKVGARYCLKKESLFWLVLVSMVFAAATQPLNMYWSVYVQNNTSNKLIFGWYWAVLMLFGIIGNQLAKFFTKRGIMEGRLIRICLLGLGVLLCGLFWIKSFWLILVIFMLHEIPRNTYDPVQQAYVNHRIPSADRATILSTISMMGSVGGVFGLLVFGAAAKYLGIVNTWAIAGICFVFLYLLARKINGHNELRK